MSMVEWLHLENDMRPLLEEFLERAQEGELEGDDFAQWMNFYESSGDLAEELLQKIMNLIKARQPA